MTTRRFQAELQATRFTLNSDVVPVSQFEVDAVRPIRIHQHHRITFEALDNHLTTAGAWTLPPHVAVRDRGIVVVEGSDWQYFHICRLAAVACSEERLTERH